MGHLFFHLVYSRESRQSECTLWVNGTKETDLRNGILQGTVRARWDYTNYSCLVPQIQYLTYK